MTMIMMMVILMMIVIMMMMMMMVILRMMVIMIRGRICISDVPQIHSLWTNEEANAVVLVARN